MGKKGKKTKKQLEDELAKAQEEQRKVDEVNRLKKLEDQAKLEQEDRIDREKGRKAHAEEADRLELENSLVEQLKSERKQTLEYEMEKIEERAAWQKFLGCVTRPDPRFENQITTYISQEEEELEVEAQGELSANRTIEENVYKAIEKCKYAEEIIADLDEIWCLAKEEDDVPKQEWCLRYKKQIRKMLERTIDWASSVLMQRVIDFDRAGQVNTRQEIFPYPEYGSSGLVSLPLPADSKADNIKLGFWGHLQTKGFRAKVIDWTKLGIQLELPKSIAMQAIGHYIGVRALYTAHDWVTFDAPSVQSGVPTLALGGVMRVDLLSIPIFPKQVNNWLMRTEPPRDEFLPSPSPNPPGPSFYPIRLTYPSETASTAAGTLQPCKLDFRVPDHVCLKATKVTVSWWDDSNNGWSDDSITEVQWFEETRSISFFSLRLAAFAITQERHSDLPYKWWQIRSLAPQEAELAVQANRFEIRILITTAGVSLLGPVLPELKGLMYEKEGNPPVRRILRPGQLLRELQRSGINMMPTDEDAQFIENLTPKAGETEARAYSDLSEIAGIFDITSSRHNRKLPTDKAICRIRENLHYEEYDSLDVEGEADYKSVLFWPNKCALVQSLESISPCNEDVLVGHGTHASMTLALESVASPEGKQRLGVSGANVRFIENVRKTMSMIRLLSFI
jgi:cancer susceptibility candidate protein 1